MEHFTPQQAFDYLHSTREAVFIDVRSEMEFLFVGHPDGSILIPWVDAPEWEVNPHFVSHVKTASSINRPVVLICRSGRRSIEAGLELEKHGLAQVYNVLHGFEGDLDDTYHRNKVNGWRFEGLPWTQT
ncbi:MAG: rhodanese-like domain-containing protein [Sulfuricellaceae bacterium]|nr:rhodanese-like domain-containing protein [Sulfuricellaceae bacterium]